jgi:adenylate kinase
MKAEYVLLFGLPGSGKGTLAKRLTALSTLRHISCGDVFRMHVKLRTPFGKLAESFIQRGQLTPDADTSRMFISHLSKEVGTGIYLLEGFPRTVAQLAEFEIHLTNSARQVRLALLLQAPVQELLRRLEDRYTCPECGAIYNIHTLPPQRQNVCDVDGHSLVRRPDDHGDVVRSRISLYEAAERPIVDYYDSRGLLSRLNAFQPMENVFQAALKIVGDLQSH